MLWKPVSLIVMLIMVLDGLIGGYGDALMPIAAVKVFGFTTPQWSNLVAVMGIIGAGVTLVLGPIIRRRVPGPVAADPVGCVQAVCRVVVSRHAPA